MASWGDLNARLNRLVREGVISGFRTNLASRPDPARLRIVVMPGRDVLPVSGEPGEADALRRRIGAALSGIAPEAAISVEEAPPGPAGARS